MKPSISLSDSHVWVRQQFIFEDSEEKCDMLNIVEFCNHYVTQDVLKDCITTSAVSCDQRKKFRWSRSLLSVHFFWYACQISVKRAAYKVFNYIQTQCTDEIQPIIFSTWVVGCTEPCYLLGIHRDDATTRALSVEMMQHDDIWSVSIC